MMNNMTIDNDYNGIFKIKLNGVEHTLWTRANVVRKYVKDELRKRFPGKLIVKELNQIDYTIPEENLPIEIQATIVTDDHRVSRKPYIKYSYWEEIIRKQIEQNIIAYNNCLFFFDSELLKAMKNAGRNMSINMDWFRKYMKEEKLKVFTVSYNGIIEEKVYKDFDFLADISQTCSIAAETDDMILNKNKMKIYFNVVKGYGFVQEEIDKFDDDYEKYCKVSKIKCVDKIKPMIGFLSVQIDKRAKIYGYILQAIGTLPDINNLLDRKPSKRMTESKYSARILGIFDTYGINRDSGITKFIDRFDVCKYFPGYLRNKETWNKLKGHNLNWRQFENVVTGKNDVIHGLDYYFNEKSNNTDENIDKEDNDNSANVELGDKGQIITININDKQKNIEEAWT